MPVRAAAYCRTSSEGQRDNTSIPTQKDETEAYIARQGWGFTRHYVDEAKTGSTIVGRDQFQLLMKDAAAGKFDVVVPWDVDRFARDGLDILTSAKTLKNDFNVVVVDSKGKFDNRDPRKTLANYVYAGMAEQQRIVILELTKKGKIAAARKFNAPVGSKRPFGRIWTRAAKKGSAGAWSLDEEKAGPIRQIAPRYIAGEKLPLLAKEYGIAHNTLHAILAHKCGPIWVQHVRCKELNIDETIETKVPYILKDDVIQRVKETMKANRTYRHDPVKHKHLLRGLVYCEACGYTLFQQVNANGVRYLRHNHAPGNKPCPAPATYIPADGAEVVILQTLFRVFGNPVRMAEAVRNGVPDPGRVGELTAKRDRALKALERVQKERQNIARAISEGVTVDEYLKERIDILAAKETAAREQLQEAAAALGDVPSVEEVEARGRVIAGKFCRMGNPAKYYASKFGCMSWEDKKALVELVFGGKKTADGRKPGVYIGPGVGGRKGRTWKFTLVGDLIDVEGYLPVEQDPNDPECDDVANAAQVFTTGPGGVPLDLRKDILDRVTESSSSEP
jgi:DNA invertase Pin-like site-specific DNA recombinase